MILSDSPLCYPKEPRKDKGEKKKDYGEGVGWFVDHRLIGLIFSFEYWCCGEENQSIPLNSFKTQFLVYDQIAA
jgi:hypothetical protein